MWPVDKWLVKDFAPSSITYLSVLYVWLEWKCGKHRAFYLYVKVSTGGA